MRQTSGAQLARQPDGFVSVARLPHDLDAVEGAEDEPQPGAHQVLVVGDHHPDGHCGTARGRVARTAHPPCRPGPAEHVPAEQRGALDHAGDAEPRPVDGRGRRRVAVVAHRSRTPDSSPSTCTSTSVAFRAWRRALVTASWAIR